MASFSQLRQMAKSPKSESGEGGIRTPRKSPEELALLENGGADSDALAAADPDLAIIYDAWPGLPGPIKAAMLAMVRTTAASSPVKV